MTEISAGGWEAGLEVSRPAPQVRSFAPSSSELDELLPQLSVDRAANRRAAVKRLSGSAHSAFVVEPLSALLRDDDRGVRRAAISALGKSGDARALAPLRSVMEGTGSLQEQAGGALGQLERRLSGRGDEARNPDSPHAIQTAREIEEAIGVRRLRLRAEVKKGVRLKLASLPLWGAGVALFGIGAATGNPLAIVAGIAIGLVGFAVMESLIATCRPRGCVTM